MIKYNNKKRKMEYGMSFEPNWQQGSTATIVQGQPAVDKVADNLAKVVSAGSALYGAFGGMMNKDGKTSAKKEEPKTNENTVPETAITDGEENGFVSKIKKGYQNVSGAVKEYTDGDGKDKYGNYIRKFSESFERQDNPDSKFHKRINEENKDKNFIQRGFDYNSGKETPSIIGAQEPGVPSTHLLTSSDNDKSSIVYPTLVQKKGSDNLEQLSDDKDWEANKYAMENNEYIPFKSKRMARMYSENGLIDHNKKKQMDGSIRGQNTRRY